MTRDVKDDTLVPRGADGEPLVPMIGYVDRETNAKLNEYVQVSGLTRTEIVTLALTRFLGNGSAAMNLAKASALKEGFVLSTYLDEGIRCGVIREETENLVQPAVRTEQATAFMTRHFPTCTVRRDDGRSITFCLDPEKYRQRELARESSEG